MLELSANNIIKFLHQYPPEMASILTLIICYIAIITMCKLWEAPGLFVYIAVAVIACNLQVLKAAQFFNIKEPIALGTIVFSSSFLASDALTELYGAKLARRAIGLSFAATILMLLLMLLTLGHMPLALASGSEHAHFNEAHNALAVLFTPAPAIIAASLLAYISSQLTDIYIFSHLKNLTSNAHLWLRTFLSLAIAALVDAFIFNILAWKIFTPLNISWHSLFFTYFSGAYIVQLTVAVINIPVLYLLLRVVRK